MGANCDRDFLQDGLDLHRDYDFRIVFCDVFANICTRGFHAFLHTAYHLFVVLGRWKTVYKTESSMSQMKSSRWPERTTMGKGLIWKCICPFACKDDSVVKPYWTTNLFYLKWMRILKEKDIAKHSGTAFMNTDVLAAKHSIVTIIILGHQIPPPKNYFFLSHQCLRMMYKEFQYILLPSHVTGTYVPPPSKTQVYIKYPKNYLGWISVLSKNFIFNIHLHESKDKKETSTVGCHPQYSYISWDVSIPYKEPHLTTGINRILLISVWRSQEQNVAFVVKLGQVTAGNSDLPNILMVSTFTLSNCGTWVEPFPLGSIMSS